MKKSEYGVSLVELAIVMMLVMVVMAGTTFFLLKSGEKSKNRATFQQIIVLSEAIKNYLIYAESIHNNYTTTPTIVDLNQLYQQGFLLLPVKNNAYQQNFALMIKKVQNHNKQTSRLEAFLFTRGGQAITEDSLLELSRFLGSNAGFIRDHQIIGWNDSWKANINDWQADGQQLQPGHLALLIDDTANTQAHAELSPTLTQVVFTAYAAGKAQTNVPSGTPVVWQPLYTNDDLILSWQHNQTVDHVQLTITDDQQNTLLDTRLGAVNSYSLAPTKNWVDNTVTIKLTPFAANNQQGNTVTETVNIKHYPSTPIEQLSVAADFITADIVQGVYNIDSLNRCNSNTKAELLYLHTIVLKPLNGINNTRYLLPLTVEVAESTNNITQNLGSWQFSMTNNMDLDKGALTTQTNIYPQLNGRVVDLAGVNCSMSSLFTTQLTVTLLLGTHTMSTYTSGSVNWGGLFAPPLALTINYP